MNFNLPDEGVHDWEVSSLRAGVDAVIDEATEDATDCDGASTEGSIANFDLSTTT